VTKVGFDAIGTSTTLESNKSLLQNIHHPFRVQRGWCENVRVMPYRKWLLLDSRNLSHY